MSFLQHSAACRVRVVVVSARGGRGGHGVCLSEHGRDGQLLGSG